MLKKWIQNIIKCKFHFLKKIIPTVYDRDSQSKNCIWQKNSNSHRNVAHKFFRMSRIDVCNELFDRKIFINF